MEIRCRIRQNSTVNVRFAIEAFLDVPESYTSSPDIREGWPQYLRPSHPFYVVSPNLTTPSTSSSIVSTPSSVTETGASISGVRARGDGDTEDSCDGNGVEFPVDWANIHYGGKHLSAARVGYRVKNLSQVSGKGKTSNIWRYGANLIHIDTDLLIGFKNFFGDHMGVNQAIAILSIINDYGIASRFQLF
ncbi:hypothetical protein K458DRAFT_394367 [Lentithecium fluviatile CBS 122367]|uniref:Uncharacterized protein n=1 Tax=Lentithecium fluviatile CBS 122367 TaxID=1168545 RepID=A0A6G1ILI5_9PLEO|nr:hypothetical protein K458DRAFT_394367 [Lentithecium fluviatile CBS 122367]